MYSTNKSLSPHQNTVYVHQFYYSLPIASRSDRYKSHHQYNSQKIVSYKKISIINKTFDTV